MATTHSKGRIYQNPRQWLECLEDRRLLSATTASLHSITVEPQIVVNASDTSGTSTNSGYTPAQIKTAYDLNNITFNGGFDTGNGSGQTIAIVDAYNDQNISSDLATFDSAYGLPSADLTIVSQSGSTTALPANNASWAGEISLDVEWAHAIAPGANILLVETNSDNLNSLLAGVTFARTYPGVSVISMSWGSSEYTGENAYDSDFTSPTGHKGITFVAAAGDDGSADGPDWPSVSPNVVAVGGTTLNLASDGSYQSESAWSSTTGGYSSVEAEPSYQDSAQSGGSRSTADVSYDADPNTGFAVYDSVAYEGYVGWQEIGGTSAGTPQWSGIIAIADQERAFTHSGTLNGGSGTLPALYSLYSNATTYANAFNDITTGGGGWRSSGATVGYDTLTGLGTPVGADVITALATATKGANSGAVITQIPPPPPRIHHPGGFYYEESNARYDGVLAQNGRRLTAAVVTPTWLTLQVPSLTNVVTSVSSNSTASASHQTPAAAAAAINSGVLSNRVDSSLVGLDTSLKAQNLTFTLLDSGLNNVEINIAHLLPEFITGPITFANAIPWSNVPIALNVNRSVAWGSVLLGSLLTASAILLAQRNQQRHRVKLYSTG